MFRRRRGIREVQGRCAWAWDAPQHVHHSCRLSGRHSQHVCDCGEVYR